MNASENAAKLLCELNMNEISEDKGDIEMLERQGRAESTIILQTKKC